MLPQALPSHWCVTGSRNSPNTLLLAPGSGSLMDSEFMGAVAQAFAEDIRVVRFEFPFQQWMRHHGRPRPPERLPNLVAFYQQQVEQVVATWPDTRLWLGGKSLGGRVAVHVLAEAGVSAAGAVVFGYPFHPVGKPDQLRTEVLQQVQRPVWIAQGTRDPFGTFDEVKGYGLAPPIQLQWLEGGNHDLRAPRQSADDWHSALAGLVEQVRTFMGLAE